MEDNTTTDAPVADGGSQAIQGVQVDDQGQAVAEPQPQTTETAEAVTPEDNTQEAPIDEEPAKDNSTVEWLKKKGVDPSSPEAIEKVAEMARNAEKAMHEKAQKASELEKSVQITADEVPVDATPADIDSARVRNIELKQQLIDWRQNNPDKRDYEAQMTEVLNQDPNVKAMVREGYISIDKLFAMTKGMDSGRDESLKSQVEKETLQKLAQKQQAAVPAGNAVASSGTGAEPITPQNVDRLVAGMSVQEYQKRLPEINAAMAG
jgi:hypothetical protein